MEKKVMRSLVMDTIIGVFLLIAVVCLNGYMIVEEAWDYDMMFALGTLAGSIGFVLNWVAKTIQKYARD